MDGQAPVEFVAESYIDPAHPFLQLMSTSQPFTDIPVASPELASFNEAQRLAELEKLSNEYTPEYTVLNSITGRLYYGTQEGF